MPTDNFFKKLPDEKSEISFVEDIRRMMYGLGDNPEPLISTAELLERIILKQLLSIIAQAKNVANMRSSDNIGPEDILFLMRKNIVGLKRLITYLAFKDEHAKQMKVVSDSDNVSEETMIMAEESRPLSWKTNRKDYCLQHLRILGIEETVLSSVEDTVKKERINRADNISQRIPASAYDNYHDARRVSFGAAQLTPTKFILWLNQGGLKFNLHSSVLEILVYLAKETLSQIIDMALTLREQSTKQYIGEPPPLSMKEVQEVVRLCWTPQSFTLGILSRDIPAYCNSRLLAV